MLSEVVCAVCTVCCVLFMSENVFVIKCTYVHSRNSNQSQSYFQRDSKHIKIFVKVLCFWRVKLPCIPLEQRHLVSCTFICLSIT